MLMNPDLIIERRDMTLEEIAAADEAAFCEGAEII
jgi:hypothetical protein